VCSSRITDGNDTTSKVPPAKAAEIARDKRIVIHTVAVGDPRAAGEDALDVDTLKKVATTTGGLYAHAANRAQLNEIYGKLDKRETHKAETESHRSRRDVFWWPLALGVFVSALQHTLQLVFDRPRSRGRPSSGNEESERGATTNERVAA